MTKVVVGMSGGVDSSVAAALFKSKDYEVAGVTMRIWDGDIFPEGPRHGCYGPGEMEDIEDTQRVCQYLGIPLHIIDLREEYKAEVLDYFCCEYMRGRTPNPCVRCNRMIKFHALIKKIRDSEIEFDYFATGHYARVSYDETRGRYVLKKAKDSRKDQSYFLFSLSQHQLSYSLFPVGNLIKDEVRNTARSLGLGVDSKPESQDFISGDCSAFIMAEAQPGPILDEQGNTLGRHRGIQFYTIGQRRGLGISSKQPLYVTAIKPEINAIVAGSKQELYHDELIASELNWIAMENLAHPIDVRAKIRYHHNEAQARVIPLDKDKAQVKFQEPQISITPGQAVVFYDGDLVVGGGTIERFGQGQEN